MHVLEIITILSTGLLIGNELGISLFVNPAIWKLDDYPQAAQLARSLGKAMPLWYALCLLLLGIEAWLHRNAPGSPLLFISAGLWFATIGYTLIALVPINNRLAAGTLANSSWREQHKRWDTFHRWRIVLLIAAMICLLLGLQS